MKSFFASFFGTIAGICLLIGLGLLFLVILLIGIASSDKTSVIPNRSLLVFDLSTAITDAPPQFDVPLIWLTPSPAEKKSALPSGKRSALFPRLRPTTEFLQFSLAAIHFLPITLPAMPPCEKFVKL